VRTPDKTTLYLPDGSELELGSTGGALGKRYYADIAVRDAAAGVKWTATNHQNTSTIQIDTATLATSRRRSMPYGEDRTATPAGWVGTKGYVGGTKDTTSYTHLGAREYDPTLGRFISVDPVMDLADPQQWNAYTYANSSPVTSSDPSGLKPQFDDLGDQRAWAATGGNKFARKKSLKGYFKQVKQTKFSNPVLAGIDSFVNGMYAVTAGGIIETVQLGAAETGRGVDRWSKVLDGEWTLGQALDDTIENSLPNMAMPWDPAVGLVNLAMMSVNAQTALLQGDFTTAAENYGYLGGVAAGILLTERASKLGGCNSFAPATQAPHVTVRELKDPAVGPRGGWKVTQKAFITGQETWKGC